VVAVLNVEPESRAATLRKFAVQLAGCATCHSALRAPVENGRGDGVRTAPKVAPPKDDAVFNLRGALSSIVEGRNVT
jgi:hypothetical protein